MFRHFVQVLGDRFWEKQKAVFSPKRLINSQKRTHSIFKKKKKENIVFINNVLLVTTRKRSKNTRPSRGSIRVAVKSCCAQCPESRSDPSPRGARSFLDEQKPCLLAQAPPVFPDTKNQSFLENQIRKNGNPVLLRVKYSEDLVSEIQWQKSK